MGTSILDLSNINPNDVPELEPAPTGEEVTVRIVSVLLGEDKNGKSYMMPFMETPEYPNAPEFGYFMSLPSQDMNEKDRGKAVRKLKTFAEAFDTDLFSGEIDVKEELVGLESQAILSETVDQDGQPVNAIKRFV
jgi:hypothetical protein